MGSFDYLKALGIDTPENVAIIHKAASLSVCSYDIESTTNKAHENDDECFPFAPLSECKIPRVVKATQRPVYIGVASCSMAGAEAAFRSVGSSSSNNNDEVLGHKDDNSGGSSNEEDEPVEILECEPGEQEDLVRRFAENVRGRRDRAVAMKTEVMEPLMSKLAIIREGFMNFFTGKQEEQELAIVGNQIWQQQQQQQQQGGGVSSESEEDEISCMQQQQQQQQQ